MEDTVIKTKKSEMTKAEMKAAKKLKKAKQRERVLRHYIDRYDRNAEELVYRFQKKLKTNPKIAIEEYKALGYRVTKQQYAFLMKKEKHRKEQLRARKEAKKRRALLAEGERYKQQIIERYYETQEINDIETWLILKDELF